MAIILGCFSKTCPCIGSMVKSMVSPAKPRQARLAKVLAGLPGKRGLEKPSKPSQGQGFEVNLAIEAWLLQPH